MISSSIVSLVVPLILDTIALSSFSIVFNKVDLPEFGLPTMDIGIPFFIAFPNLNDSNSFSILDLRPSINLNKSFLLANSIMSP